MSIPASVQSPILREGTLRPVHRAADLGLDRAIETMIVNGIGIAIAVGRLGGAHAHQSTERRCVKSLMAGKGVN